MKLLTLSAVLLIIAICGAFWLSPWIGFAICVLCLVCMFVASLINNSPIDPPWAEETPWFNCPKCDYSFTKDGQKAIIVPKPCAPMELCPRCRDEVKGQIMGSLNNYFNGGKEQFVRRN